MEDEIFKSAIFIFIIACGLIRMPFMQKCKEKHSVKSKFIKFERIKVFIAWLGMFLVPMLFIFTNLLSGYDINLSLYIRTAAVIGLFLNTVFFYYIHKELNDNWSPVLDIKENQKLIKTGVYKYIRHPMYTQCWLWVILQGFVAANLFVLIFGILSWGFLYFTRVFNEEKMMIECFNEEYIEYMKHTGRLLPKL